MKSNTPMILAYYFAQYHSIPENDEIFGEGFTDWNLFNNTSFDMSSCKKPLDTHNGLGYYNPTQYAIRTQQANLASKYGIDGFIYYHYWLENRPVMTKVLDALLEDNQPNIPFCLCFANESWRHCYGSQTKQYKSLHNDGTTFRQLYDDPVRHAEYLQRLFKHDKYIKIDNAPVLFVYRSSPEVYEYLDKISKELVKFGVNNIYIIANTGTYCLSQHEHSPWIHPPNAYSPFPAHNLKSILKPLPDAISGLPIIRSGLIGWNSIPRHGTASRSHSVHTEYSPNEITEQTLRNLLIISCDSNSLQMYALFAWNEWGEGATIEPNNINGEAIGYSIKRAKDMYHLIQSRISKLTFLYGIEGQYTNITKSVIEKCIELDITNSTCNIVIPRVDMERDLLFGDPLPSVHKMIKIIDNETHRIYDENTPIHISLL